MERKNLLTWNGKQTLKASPGRATQLSTREEGGGISMHGCVCRHVWVCVSFECSYMKLPSAPGLPAKCAALLVFSLAGRGAGWKTTRLGELLLLLCSLGLAWRYLSSCATWSAFRRERGGAEGGPTGSRVTGTGVRKGWRCVWVRVWRGEGTERGSDQDRKVVLKKKNWKKRRQREKRGRTEGVKREKFAI